MTQRPNNLTLTLVLVGALFTMGAKWAEIPIEHIKDIAGTWEGTYIKDGTKYPVSLNIKEDGSYEGEDWQGPLKGTLTIKEGRIQYPRGEQSNFILTLEKRKKKRLLRVSDKRGELDVTLKPAKGKRAKRKRKKKTKLSLAKAKKITAGFDDISFTPPPRTIEDITHILQESRRSSVSQLQQARDIVSREPPASSNRNTLARFYIRRARAHHTLGRNDREIADYRLASQYAQGRLLFWAAMELSWAEWRGGNWSRAISEVEKACEEAHSRIGSEPWDAWYCTGELTRYAALMGNVPRAEATWKEAERIRAQFSIVSWTPRGRADHETTRNHYKAQVLLAKGKLADVETLARRAVREFHPYRDKPLGTGKDIQPDINARTYTWHLRLLSETLRRDGRSVEAEVEARKALLEALRASGRYSDHSAQNVEALVAVLVEQGRYAEAQMLVQANLEIYETVGVPPDSYMMAKTRVRIADALTAQGQWAEAVAEFNNARNAIKEDRVWSEQLLSDNLNWPLSLLKDGQMGEARVILEAGYAKRRENLRETHYDTAEARALLAMAVAGMGERESALAHLRAAVPLLLQRSRRSDREGIAGSMRGSRLDLILDAYIRLLADIAGSSLEEAAGIDAVEEAFRMADVARSGSVHRALSATAARAAIHDPEIAGLVRREQDAVKRIGGLYGSLARNLSLPSAERDAAAIEATRKRIDELRAARATLMEAIEARSPEYAALINPKAPTFSQLRRGLMPGEVVLAFYVSEAATYVWAVGKSGAAAFATVALGRKALTQAVMRLRSALDPDASTLGSIPQFDVNTAHDLYQRLLMPVASAWLGAQNLVVMADGALAQIPLSLLVTSPTELGPERASLFSRYREVAWLAREYAVVVVPSATALIALRMLPEGGKVIRTYAGFGDPWFSLAQAREARSDVAGSVSPIAGANENEAPTTGASMSVVQSRGFERRNTPKTRGVSSADLARLPRLPDTAKEVLSIARALDADLSNDVFLGQQASEHVVKTIRLDDRKVLVFATHGLLPGDLDGLVQPALALSSPAVTGEKDDGLLTMGEILGLKLNADWVVLSACNTAAAEGAGAEAVSGLGRAFFYAGARALLVSNWPVETTSAKALTTDLFQRQAKNPLLTRAQALQQAMLALIDGPGYVDAQGRTLFSYAHPIFWAPFTLVGDGG